MSKKLLILSGPLSFLLCLFLPSPDAEKPHLMSMLGITLWVAIWWLSEAVDIAIASFLPVLLIPALGIADVKIIAKEYMDPIIFLFMGGFIVALALEKWHLHHRISLAILQKIGDSPAKILMGMMLVTFFLSMWMSNTATTLMLYPAVLAVIAQLKQVEEAMAKKAAVALLLGLAYAASLGGMGTLVGTPTNMIFYSFYQNQYPDATDMSFAHWFIWAFPISLLLLAACFGLLWWNHLRAYKGVKLDKTYFKEAWMRLGEMSREEKWVSLIFGLTALLWFTRESIPFGSFTFVGWSNFFPQPKWISDGFVAIAMAMLLFFIPAREGKMLMDWEDVSKLPLGILLLFGAGFALSKGFEVSGLSQYLAQQLTFLKGYSPIVIILGICFMIAIISEFASNVASIQLSLPILVSLQQTLDVHPLMLMLPATLAASLGFMLPVATAPNTIVFGSGQIPVKAMWKSGFYLDLIGVLLIALVCSMR